MSRARLPNRRGHELVGFNHAGLDYTGGVGRFDDGTIAELFVSAAKAGTAIEAWARDAAIVASIALQTGTDLGTIRQALSRDHDGSPATPLAALIDIVTEGGTNA